MEPGLKKPIERTFKRNWLPLNERYSCLLRPKEEPTEQKEVPQAIVQSRDSHSRLDRV